MKLQIKKNIFFFIFLGFHIIVEENCRKALYDRIDFSNSVYISTTKTDGIPERPQNTTAGVCTPKATTRSYEYYQGQFIH